MSKEEDETRYVIVAKKGGEAQHMILAKTKQVDEAGSVTVA